MRKIGVVSNPWNCGWSILVDGMLVPFYGGHDYCEAYRRAQWLCWKLNSR